MKVYLVYNGDGWLSKDSMNLVAVCTSKDKALDCVKKDAIDNYDEIVSVENIQDEEFDEDMIYVEDILNEIERNNQWLGCGFGYVIQECNTDEIL